MSELKQELERDVGTKPSTKAKVEQLIDNIEHVIVDANADEEELAKVLDALREGRAHLAELCEGAEPPPEAE
jgi:hypothetical protein